MKHEPAGTQDKPDWAGIAAKTAMTMSRQSASSMGRTNPGSLPPVGASSLAVHRAIAVLASGEHSPPSDPEIHAWTRSSARRTSTTKRRARGLRRDELTE
jgi:hypothetical protein